MSRHSADAYSTLFEAFVEHLCRRRVLDVGCGPSGRPFYLTSYPSALVSGIDPLPRSRQPGLQVVRGISEYLPWPDQSFRPSFRRHL